MLLSVGLKILGMREMVMEGISFTSDSGRACRAVIRCVSLPVRRSACCLWAESGSCRGAKDAVPVHAWNTTFQVFFNAHATNVHVMKIISTDPNGNNKVAAPPLQHNNNCHSKRHISSLRRHPKQLPTGPSSPSCVWGLFSFSATRKEQLYAHPELAGYLANNIGRLRCVFKKRIVT